MTILPALLAAAAFAATSPAASSAPPAPADATADWLRVYTSEPYREFWSVSVEVKKLDTDLPKILKAFEGHGAVLRVPLANSAGSFSTRTQQLSYGAPAKAIPPILKELKKIGTLAAPRETRQGQPLPATELKLKIDALSRDKAEHGRELAQMPAVSALVEAVLRHLVTTQAINDRTGGEAIVNLTVQEKGGGAKK